ncbi:MAG: nucleoside phosphorylase [Actinomycetota bacterium]|nr:nucleoside phosphorylase [Actinomycetota bacterium]
MAPVVLPNLRATSDDVAERVVVVGDPERAEQAAKHLSDGGLVAANREYRLFTGRYGDAVVSVCSHGVGSAGAAVCFEELMRGGARRIVRAGTCGGLQPEVQRGSVVVATGAVRADGASAQMVPLGYPAVADHALTRALEAAATAGGLSVRRGVVCTHDLFYPSPAMPPDWGVWLRAGVLAVEMELATLLVLASLHGVAAAGILVADGNILDSAGTMVGYDPHHEVVAEAKLRMMTVALDAVVAERA